MLKLRKIAQSAPISLAPFPPAELAPVLEFAKALFEPVAA
jgi:hypothetical protein